MMSRIEAHIHTGDIYKDLLARFKPFIQFSIHFLRCQCVYCPFLSRKMWVDVSATFTNFYQVFDKTYN